MLTCRGTTLHRRVVESSDEWAPQIASALAANAMSFIAPDGSASFVVKNDITAIEQFSNVATFIPVATKTVVTPHCTRARASSLWVFALDSLVTLPSPDGR